VDLIPLATASTVSKAIEESNIVDVESCLGNFISEMQKVEEGRKGFGSAHRDELLFRGLLWARSIL
jgi:hypothetical protein